MNKEKISQELATAIQLAIESQGGAEYVLAGHHDLDWCMGCEPLNELSHMELVELLVNGYEVIKTPEDQIIELCQLYKSDKEYGNADVTRAIRKALRIIGFKVDWTKIKG